MVNEISKIYSDIAELVNLARIKAYQTINSIIVEISRKIICWLRGYCWLSMPDQITFLNACRCSLPFEGGLGWVLIGVYKINPKLWSNTLYYRRAGRFLQANIKPYFRQKKNLQICFKKKI